VPRCCGEQTGLAMGYVRVVAPSEFDVTVAAGRTVRVRDAGDRAGQPVVFLHGCPSSRLDLHLSDDVAEDHGVRLVSFDRPGYGRSTAAPFSLVTVAHDVAAIADEMRIETFAVFGQSAGSAYALAAAALYGERVSCVGLASAVGPVLPGSLGQLDPEDRAIHALIDEPEAAARLCASYYERVVHLAARADDDQLVAEFEPLLTPADGVLLHDPIIRAGAAMNLREALRQGSEAAGWDVVARFGPWGFEVSEVQARVWIWSGEEDTTPTEDGTWLRDQLADARLVLWPAEGHLAYKRHLDEIFKALTAA
jgi:pimeloyl-ACP methyl ester carboxylesterase